MALAANALTTVAQAKSHIGIDSSDTSQDSLLEFYINSVSEFIERYTSRKFAKGDYTLKLSGEGLSRIYLSYFPIVSISSVKISGITVPTDGYVVNNDTGELLYKNGIWPKASQNIEVVFTGGYVLPSASSGRNLPYDLEMACIRLAAETHGKREAEGIQNASAGGVSVNWQDAMHESIKAILDRYKIHHV